MPLIRAWTKKLNWPTDTAADSNANHKTEIGWYIAKCRMLKAQQDRLIFWQQWDQVYAQLAAVALDLVLAPASEAYCERVFSVCGELSDGKRNRLSKNLECWVFMRMNHELLSCLWLTEWLVTVNSCSFGYVIIIIIIIIITKSECHHNVIV